MTASAIPSPPSRSRRLARKLGLLMAGLLLPSMPFQAAQAQIAAPSPQAPIIDRDRVDRQDPDVPRAPAPAQVPQAQTPVVATPAAPSGGAGVALTGLRYEGSTLPKPLLDKAVAAFIGAPLNRDNLQKIANAISTTYGQSDIAFFAVSIPQQVPTGGVLTVRVLEGRITRYTLDGKTRSTPTRLIDAQVKRLLRETPTHKSTIERTISLLRDIPGQTVQASLKQTPTPGELALDLKVDRKQVDVTLNVNNNGIVNVTTGVQTQLSVAVNGVLREGDTTRFSGNLPFNPDRYQFYSLSHATPIGSNGTTLGVSGAYVRTKTRDLNIIGEAKQGGIAISHPLIRSYRRNLSLSLSLDGTNSTNYFLDTAFGGFKTRALRLGTVWSSIDKTGGYAISTSLSQGLDALGARPIEGYSDASFRKANVQLTAIKELTKAVSVKATLRGQYSGDRLPTTERFPLGGEGAGMAYRIGIITSDKAAAGSLELSWRVAGKPAGATRGLTVFAYTDGALAHSYERPAYRLAAQDFSLATAGAGVRVTPVKGWTATAQIAVPVKSPSEFYSKKARFFFSVNRTV
ncbi:hemolysin activation/secretion protein [Novosphingobium sp. PhB55]|uniref:ShlB/FhaC/HecB family hemolysin secretion/activation protein n=1 Tax=Novosphingobium sp. PhB55 TaxID=2485106 RepID=UPI0010F0082C|nr:ShlB/FhaC/HecB family hemolysin secretion/activation protein [Novosphingobium sp. PhB55]TDW67147.1 hemolysin activation/secretion protein [Novosphingobium sp. PhB55]